MVGKVPSRSIVELWYEFEAPGASVGLSEIVEVLNRNETVEGEIVLTDHNGSEIQFDLMLSHSTEGRQ